VVLADAGGWPGGAHGEEGAFEARCAGARGAGLRAAGLVEQLLALGFRAQALDVRATLDEEEVGMGHEHETVDSCALYSLHCELTSSLDIFRMQLMPL
jgi:hypothetical protein